MATETLEEFLARGGEIAKSDDTTVSLEKLLKREGVLNEDGAKAIADLLTSTISNNIETEFKTEDKKTK